MSSIALFGGTSEIAVAIAAELLKSEPREVVLAARAESSHLDWARTALLAAGATGVRVVDLDAARPESHPKVVDEVFDSAIDTAVIAFGVLGDADTWRHHGEVVELAMVNYVGALSVGTLAGQKMAAQGSGAIVALSSVAGERVRRSNFVYGSSKAGMDGYFLQLGEALRESGVQVLVVRPGRVATRMIAGTKNQPLTTTPKTVARRVVKALADGTPMIRVPRVFAVVMGVFRHLPAGLVRRLPF